MKRTNYTIANRPNGVRYLGELLEGSESCMETVTRFNDMGGTVIHEESFPTACLGDASRDEYTRVMTRCVVEKLERAQS